MKQKMAPRADRELGHVIISEAASKLGGKRVKQLPFPYQNADQFNKAMSQPIGNTWNTAASFREMTAPSIVTTPGQIIAPATVSKQSFCCLMFFSWKKSKDTRTYSLLTNQSTKRSRKKLFQRSLKAEEGKRRQTIFPFQGVEKKMLTRSTNSNSFHLEWKAAN